LPDKQTFQRANKMGACPRECVPKLRVTEPLLCTKTFIPFYPNTLPGVPKPSRASRAPSSVIISLGWSRGATTRLENRCMDRCQARRSLPTSRPGVILTRHALEGIAWNLVLKISHHEYVEVKASLYFLFRGMKDSPQPKSVGSPQA